MIISDFIVSQRVLKPLVAALLLTATLPGKAAESTAVEEPAAATGKTETKPVSKTTLKYESLLLAVQKTPPPPGAVITIGSSQMEFWKTISADLAPLTVYNHGIGGSRMFQAADLYITNLAIPFKPRAVILYEGSNDIAGGITPEKILEQFKVLHGKLHTALPETRLYVLGLVPSPGARFEKIDDVKKTNALLQKECESQAWMKFIDTTTPLIGADGQPKAECFIPGNIHMTPAGYEVWKAAIAPVVLPVEKKFEK